MARAYGPDRDERHTHRNRSSGNKADRGPIELDMTDNTRIVALVGSLRTDSLNRRIAERLRDESPEGVEVTIAEGLADIPFYNEDLDSGDAPAAATALRDLVADADAVLTITPEFNGTMPAVINNAIDWLSRPYGAGAIQGKKFAVVGTTPTPYGGKWAHDDARRSAGIAGADVVADVVVSQTVIDVDPFAPEVFSRFTDAVRALQRVDQAA